MENNQERIDELISKIDENNIDLKQIYQSAGERVAAPGVFTGEIDEVKEQLVSLSDIDNKISSIDLKIEDLRNSFNRIAEITDREKEIGEEFSNLEKENRKLFLPIGEAAFHEWKNNPLDDQNKIMSGLVEVESKITDLDNEILQLSDNDVKKSVFVKIKEKSRIALLNTKKKNRQSSMNTLYKKVGEKLYRKDISYFENMKNASVGTFILNRRKLDNLSNETQALKDENSRLEKHLKNSFSSSKQQKAEDKLQSERDFIISEKMAQLNDLGSLLYSRQLDFEDKEIRSLFKSAGEIHEKNDVLNDEIEKCKAELEIEKLDEEVADIKNNIKELENTIEICTNDIAEFNKEIKRARAEIRKLKKVTDLSPKESED